MSLPSSPLKEQDTHTHTAGEKDTDCSVCSPDIVHIWYGTLAPNSLRTRLPFTLYYFMLIEKYYIQHHLSLLPRHPTTDLNACVYLYRQVKTGGRVGDWLRVCLCTCESRGVIGEGTNAPSCSDLSISPTSHQDWTITFIHNVCCCRLVLSALTSTCHHLQLKLSVEHFGSLLGWKTAQQIIFKTQTVV